MRVNNSSFLLMLVLHFSVIIELMYHSAFVKYFSCNYSSFHVFVNHFVSCLRMNKT